MTCSTTNYLMHTLFSIGLNNNREDNNDAAGQTLWEIQFSNNQIYRFLVALLQSNNVDFKNLIPIIKTETTKQALLWILLEFFSFSLILYICM